MTDEEPWKVRVAGPAQRALAETIPIGEAWAAWAWIRERLPQNPHRLGGELYGKYAGCRSAHLGNLRIRYRIDEDTRTVHVQAVRLRADMYGV